MQPMSFALIREPNITSIRFFTELDGVKGVNYCIVQPFDAKEKYKKMYQEVQDRLDEANKKNDTVLSPGKERLK
mgnify:CR=1 FL=1